MRARLVRLVLAACVVSVVTAACSVPAPTVLRAEDVPDGTELLQYTAEYSGRAGEDRYPRPAGFLWCDDVALQKVRGPWTSSLALLPASAVGQQKPTLTVGLSAPVAGVVGLDVAAEGLVEGIEYCVQMVEDWRAEGAAQGGKYGIEELTGFAAGTRVWRLHGSEVGDVTQWGELAVTTTSDGRVLVVGVTTTEEELPYSIEEALDLGLAGAERVAGS